MVQTRSQSKLLMTSVATPASTAIEIKNKFMDESKPLLYALLLSATRINYLRNATTLFNFMSDRVNVLADAGVLGDFLIFVHMCKQKASETRESLAKAEHTDVPQEVLDSCKLSLQRMDETLEYVSGVLGETL
jgi:hypothetical protein